MSNSRFQSLWDNAVNEKAPDANGTVGVLLRAMGNRLGVEVVEVENVGNAALFLMDLSALGFRGMDINVVMVTHPPQDDEEAQKFAELLADYKHAVRSLGFCFHLTLQRDPPLPNPYVSSYVEQVSLCGQDIERLLTSEAPHSVLFGVIRRQVQLHQLCPFNTTREARGAMFRGRRQELNRLVAEINTHFVLTGARRIGKTSLLRKASDTLRVKRDMEERVFYFDCSIWGDFYDCVHRLAHAIEPRKETRIDRSTLNISYMLERKSYQGKRPLILFFDEFDRLVDYESQTGWQFLRILHEAASNNWTRLTFAGFRSVSTLVQSAERHQVYGSPFDRSLEMLTLSPLTLSEMEGLLCDPFRAVEIVLRDRDEIVSAVQRSSAGYPFLVQFFGERLFQKALTKDQRELTPEDVAEIEYSFELRDFLLSHFLNNTLEHGKPEVTERLCALLYADGEEAKGGWTEQNFWQACQHYGYAIEIDTLQQALRNLYHAHVFRYGAGGYTFTLPLLRTTLKTAYPDIPALLQAMTRR